MSGQAEPLPQSEASSIDEAELSAHLEDDGTTNHSAEQVSMQVTAYVDGSVAESETLDSLPLDGEATNFIAEVIEEKIGFQPIKLILETALLTSAEPLSLAELKKLSDGALDSRQVEALLEEIMLDWQVRGVELTKVASGWRFRAKPEMQSYLEKLNPQKPPRYSRAVLETLAIIAYHQPVTRGDIEEIRGVSVSSQILKTLEARGWIEVIGTRDTPGKPELFATTKQMLDDLNLRTLQELPSLDEIGVLLEQDADVEGVTEAQSQPPPPAEVVAE